MKEVSVDLADEFEQEAMRALASATWDGPIAMVNFRKYRDQALYPDDSNPPCTGREAYARFFEAAAPGLGDVGAQVVFGCDYISDIIDLGSGDWDEIVIIQYPSRRAFLTRWKRQPDLAKPCFIAMPACPGLLWLQLAPNDLSVMRPRVFGVSREACGRACQVCYRGVNRLLQTQVLE